MFRVIIVMVLGCLTGPALAETPNKDSQANARNSGAGPLAVDWSPSSPQTIVLSQVLSELTLDRTVCQVSAAAPGVTVRAPASLLFEDKLWADDSFVITVADGNDGCAGKTRSLNVLRLSQKVWPSHYEQLDLWFDSGVAEVAGPEIRKRQLVAVSKGLVFDLMDCSGQADCALTVSPEYINALELDGGENHFEVWPVQVPLVKGQALPLVLDGQGLPLSENRRLLEPHRVVFDRPLLASGRLDSSLDRVELPVRKPGSIDRVRCVNAECRLTAEGVLIFQIDPAAAQVRLRYSLKSKLFRKVGGRLLAKEKVEFDLEPCRIRFPREVPLLGGTSNHRYFLKMPRGCSQANTADLAIETTPATSTYVRSEVEIGKGGRLLEVVFDRVPAGIDRLDLVIFERTAVARRLGSVRLLVSEHYAPSGLRMEEGEIGPLTFIPSNREADLRWTDAGPEWKDRLAVVDRCGFYRVSKKNGAWRIKGEAGASGSVPLRLVFRPSELDLFLGDAVFPKLDQGLVAFDSEAIFAVREVNLPMPLLAGALDSKNSFIEVGCEEGDLGKTILVGKPARIPFQARDGCRILFHLDRIPSSYGTQRLRVKAGNFNQVLELLPNAGSLTISIPPGERAEYDTLLVVVAHDLLSGHYMLKTRQKVGEEARYRIILSDSSVRIGATTALPTGMFRFGSGQTEGTVPLSAGALSRFTYVQSDGRDFPVGLEFGLFGTNLSGQPDFSVVGGIGLSIPVLNANTPLQASFNIHVWAELAPTRAARDEGVFAFLFGPSFTVGRLSTTL